jgi:hypothetical protein
MRQILKEKISELALRSGILLDTTRESYYEKSIGSENLLICVGDSWTWGDSLGKIYPGQVNDDFEYRTNHIYGALLSQKLNADFLNIGRCGCSNINIHDFVAKAIPQVIGQYENINVVITLTEICREILTDPIWVKNLNYSSLNSLLMSYENTMIRHFQNLFDSWPSVNFVVGRNFSFTYPENINLSPCLLPKIWVEILEENQNLIGETYPKSVRMMSGMAIDPFKKFLSEQKLLDTMKHELIELFLDSVVAINWLDKSELNNKVATRHPNERGHEVWAEYLYNVISAK